MSSGDTWTQLFFKFYSARWGDKIILVQALLESHNKEFLFSQATMRNTLRVSNREMKSHLCFNKEN